MMRMETQKRGKKGSQSARREGKRRGIEHGVGRCLENDDAPSILSLLLDSPPNVSSLAHIHAYSYTWVTSWWFFCVKPPPPPSPRWRIFSSCGGLVSFFERGALGPLRTSAGTSAALTRHTYIFVCVYACVYCVHACASGHTRSPLPFAASFVRLYIRSRRVEANSGKRRRQGVAAISCTGQRVYLVEKYFLRSLRHRYWQCFSLSFSPSFFLTSSPSGLKYLEATTKLLLLFSLWHL